MTIHLSGSAFERPVHHPGLTVRCHLCTSRQPAATARYLHFAFFPKPYVVVCDECSRLGQT